MHGNHNSRLLNFWVIALCSFSYLNFVWSISTKLLARVMKFFGWIDLIKGECSAQEPYLLFAFFFSYCPLFIFILDFCPKHISKTVQSMVMKFFWVDRSHQGGVQCTWSVTLACLSFELLPFFNSYLNFFWSISPNYTSYDYEILWVDRSHQGGVQCTWTVTLV